jgi:two-component system sensor histidine kinase DegS
LRKGKVVQLEKELEELTTALRRDVGEVRRTIFALRPLDLETLGFLPALEKFISDFANSNDIQVDLERLGSLTNLSTKLQSALFRLIQESLNNIRKHAHASHAWIQLEVDERWAKLTVRDDGKGFNPEQALQAARQRGSVGMIQMRERVERAGGSFDLDTALGKGTRIDVKLPMK